MTPNEVVKALQTLTDGQSLKVKLLSGNIFDGVYDAENTSAEELHFETLDGKALCADWEKVDSIAGMRAAEIARGKFFMPEEHPMSGGANITYDERGTPMKPHTTRNR